MAKALICNSCAAKGKPAFATLHAEGKVGVGKRARGFDADFCDEHGQAFTELVGNTEKKATGPKPGTGRGSTPRVPADVTKRDILRFLISATEPVKGPQIYATVHSPVGATKKALIELREAHAIVMDGTKGRARYAITKKGRDQLRTNRKGTKKKAPAAKAASAPSEQRAARRRLRRPQAGRRRHRR